MTTFTLTQYGNQRGGTFAVYRGRRLGALSVVQEGVAGLLSAQLIAFDEMAREERLKTA